VGLQAQQIVALACQAAGAPGYTAQAGQLLNVILQELCQTYDFQSAKKFFTFNFQPGLASSAPYIGGSGPYPLPADFLRCKGDKSVWWELLGVPYPMIPIDQSEMDMTVQQAGLNDYPYWFCTDTSLNDNATPVAYVYPPPSGAFPVFVRHYSQMADIAAPETSTVVPWFSNTQYLRTRLTGEIMAITDDERAVAYLGDSDMGAQGILSRYMKMEGDKENRAQTVSLDRRTFRGSFNRLRNTKTIGW